MSVGGVVSQAIITAASVFVEIDDKGCRQWRSLALSRRSRCIGVGDSLWWQNHQGYWTPAESRRLAHGMDRDVSVGSCWACEKPTTTEGITP